MGRQEPVMIHPLREDSSSNNIKNMSAIRSHLRSGEDDEGDSLQPPKRRGYRRHSCPPGGVQSPHHNNEIIFNQNQSSQSPTDYLSSKENFLVRKGSATSTMSMPVVPQAAAGGTTLMFLKQQQPGHRPRQSINRVGSTTNSTMRPSTNTTATFVDSKLEEKLNSQQQYLKESLEREQRYQKQNLERGRSIDSTNSIGSSDTLPTIKTSNTTKDQFWRSRRPSYNSTIYSMGSETSNMVNKSNEYSISSSNSVVSNYSVQISLDGSSVLDVISEEGNEVQGRFLQFQPNLNNNNSDNNNSAQRKNNHRRTSLGGNDASEIAKIDEILSERRKSFYSTNSTIPEERQPTSILEESEEIPSLIGKNGRRSSPEVSVYSNSIEISSSNVHDLESLQKFNNSDRRPNSPDETSSYSSKKPLMQKQKSTEQLRGDESIWSIGSASMSDRNREKEQGFSWKSYKGVLMILLCLSLILFIVTTIILAVGFRQKSIIIPVIVNTTTSPTTAVPTTVPSSIPIVLPTTSMPTTEQPTSLPTEIPTTALPTAMPTTASPTAWLSEIGEVINGNFTNEISGSYVELANNGNVLAISRDGVVRVFQKFNAKWTQIGNDIEVKGSNNVIPHPVALSRTLGNTIAVLSERVIVVWMYNDSKNEWQQKGQTILTDTDVSTSSITISASGSNMAFSLSSGHIYVYNYGRGNRWSLIGDFKNFIKETALSVEISGSGNRLLVGSWLQFEDGDVYQNHTVHVYEYNNGGPESWNRYGNEIRLTDNSSESKVSVSFDSDGKTFAACTEESCGVYGMNEQDYTWDAIVDDIDGGNDVKLSGDGKVMIVSSPQNSDVFVYQTAGRLAFGRNDKIVRNQNMPNNINQIGQSIAISGKSVAVSSIKENNAGQFASTVNVYKLQ